MIQILIFIMVNFIKFSLKKELLKIVRVWFLLIYQIPLQ